MTLRWPVGPILASRKLERTHSYIFLYLVSLIFIYIVASDFAALASKVEANGSIDATILARATRADLIQTVTVVVITGIWLATCIKLQITYLSSDGMNFWSWFANDATSALGLNERNGTLGQSAIRFTTTSLMALLSFVVLIYAIAKTAPPSRRVVLAQKRKEPERFVWSLRQWRSQLMRVLRVRSSASLF